VNAGIAPARPIGHHGDECNDHTGTQSVDALVPPVSGDASPQDHVKHEEGAIGEREDEAQWLAAQPDPGEQKDARRREGWRQTVPASSDPNRRQSKRTQKLDGSDRSQRQAGNRR
jgi:hypothetical protein